MRKRYEERPWQIPIIRHQLEVPRNAVWAGMGLGKTSATLTSLECRYMSGEAQRPTLVLAPKRVAQSTWPDEVLKWDHLHNIECRFIGGSAAERRNILRDTNTSLFTMNYELLPWLVETLGEDWPFGSIVLDEATRLKSTRVSYQTNKTTGKKHLRAEGSVRGVALARVVHKRCDWFTELTGTPSPNGLKDLWGQMWFIDGGQRLGRTYDSYMQRWFRLKHGSDRKQGNYEPMPHSDVEIAERLRDVCISLDAADYFDLEKPIFREVQVHLPDKAMTLYNKFKRELVAELESGAIIDAINAGVKTGRGLQIASGAIYHQQEPGDNTPRTWEEIHDVKMQALESIVEEAAGMPVLIGYHWKHTLERMQKHFGAKLRELDENPQTIRDWNAGKIPMLAAHPKSCGHGLNLQDGGNIVALVDHDWNLEDYLQIIERIGPMRQAQSGYNRPVWVYLIVAVNTLDETVIERRETKEEVQAILKRNVKRWAA